MNELRMQWEKVKIACAQDDLETMMRELQEYFKIDAKQCEHPAVKNLLESCAESAGIIAFEYYASLK